MSKYLNFKYSKFVSCFGFRASDLNPQAGVTLLLSILIVSGLTLIAVAIATFAVQELRSSRAVIVTEPTIAAAESGGEKGVWVIKREIGEASLATCPTRTIQNLTNNTQVSSCRSFGEATVNISSGQNYVFLLYNTDDINGDVDLLHCNPNQNTNCYNSITVTYVSGNVNGNVTVTRIDNTTGGISPSSATLAPGNPTVISVAPVGPGFEGRMKVVLSAPGDITVRITTDRGMPTIPTVDALACGSQATVTSCSSTSQELFSRRINVTVPQ